MLLDKRLFVQAEDGTVWCLHEAAYRLARSFINDDPGRVMDEAVQTILINKSLNWSGDARGSVLEAYILHNLTGIIDWNLKSIPQTEKAAVDADHHIQLQISQVMKFSGQTMPDQSFDRGQTTLFVPVNSNYPSMCTSFTCTHKFW